MIVYIMELVIATKNQNKIIEIKEKFSGLTGLRILSLMDFDDLPEVVEDGSTFEENALKKAKTYSGFTGLTALSDDSGIVIDSLNGDPGVRSARFSGEYATDDDNNNLVLEKLKNIPNEKKTARFVCVIAIAQPDGKTFTAKGTCEGRILRVRKGNNGFGYDPIFFLPGLGKTMAELSIAEKNKISHRALALDEALKILKKIIL
jgi:XTP/dITP diphosphohydrolase